MEGVDVLLEHVYLDEAVSGAGSDRPGLNRLLDVAFAKGKRTFDVILVNDTSRLSRSLADSVRITERLKFEGIRLVAVSQGIDSHDEQSDVMMTVHSEIYVGRVIWNKSKWIKRPGTNKRVRRPRSESEWKIIDRPDLRIITEECWAAVQQKIAYTMEKYSNGARKGLANRIQTSPYLLSGFLKCNDCGAHLVIVSGRGGKWARYGCTQHWNRGACKNDLTIRRSDVEREFLKELEAFSTLEHVTNFVFNEFVKQLRENLDSGDNSFTQLKRRKEHVEAEIETLLAEIETLLDALAKGVPAASLKKMIAAREKELEEIKAQLKNNKQEQFELQLAELRKLVQGQIFSVRSLIAKQKENAKYELSKTVKEIWMVPSKNAEGKRFYFGIGKWNLLGSLAPLLSRFFELLEFLAVLRIRKRSKSKYFK